MIHAHLVTLSRWLWFRYVAKDVTFHHPIVVQVWYPFIIQQVRKAATSGLQGDQKRAMVVEAAIERFRARGLPCPPLHDLHLAIEYAVRDHAH